MRWCVRVLVPFTFLVASACSHPLRPAEEPHVQLISASYPVSEIRAALVRALQLRKFTPEREEEGRIFAHFQKKDETVHIVVEYSVTQWGIRYVDSSGLGETKDANGTLMVDSRYGDLVNRLDKGIADELKRPAKEAAAAERHEREYQAMLQLGRTAQAAAEAQTATANASADGATQAQAEADAAQANADAAQANANAPAPTIINNNTTIVRNNVNKNVVVNRTAPASTQFCDKAVKAIWVCPSTPAMNACMQNRGKCSTLCRVGGGC